MSTLVAVITVATMHICSGSSVTISENTEIKKPQNHFSKEMVIYKKVPTKWVKITKKSN